MNRRNAGFSLVELLMVIAIFGFVLAGTSQMFVSMVTTQRQQSKIAETNIEGIIGLELLRQDLGKAGYGLPWNGLTAYSEAAGDPYTLNEATATPVPAPRGIVSANNVAGGTALPGTDYLVIKAINVATNAACGKWTFLSSGATITTTSWTPGSENLSPDDRVIVLSPGVLTSSTARNLITSGTLFSLVSAAADTSSNAETRIVYGVDPNTTLSMPFNRADYHVRIPASGEMPQRCAVGTGNLYKAVVNQGDGRLTYMPLLDCVADMQVIYRRDLNADGVPEDWIQDISASNAQQIRDQVKEVRIFILAQEGQMDRNYVHSVNPIHVGDPSLGRDFNFDTNSITNWQNYRWKIYTLVVKLDNLL